MSVTASLGAFAAIASLTALARRSLRGADSGSVAPTGVAGADALMNGGLPKAGLVELLVSSEEACAVRLMEGAVAHLGDALWILADRGARPAARDCIAAGVDLAGQLLVTPPSGREAFEAAEAAAASGEFRAVIAFLPPLAPEADRVAMRRLALAAENFRVLVAAIRTTAMVCTTPCGRLRLMLTPAAGGTVRLRALGGASAAREAVLHREDFAPARRPEAFTPAPGVPSDPSLFPELPSGAMPAPAL